MNPEGEMSESLQPDWEARPPAAPEQHATPPAPAAEEAEQADQTQPEQLAAELGPGMQVNLPLLNLELGGGIPIGVAPAPQLGEGGRALVIGPFLLRLFVPLSQDAARTVGRDLSGGIEIASGLGGQQLRAAQAEGRARGSR